MNLLLPIYLYRRLLKGHRKHLPTEIRLLGDEYVKSEFRAHRNVENPAYLVNRRINSFQTNTAHHSSKGAIEGNSWVGEKLEQGKIDKMSDEQLGQLYELMKAIQKRGADEDNSGNEP
ncbi:succinate dehydrogenase assembly factor 3, mitochondrial [Cladorrhinum sp. PSN259]|nr:succinate dehydrogenase assembly factor 3, mitochondrial [Cladorrhinum sp. PSN259]